MFVDMKLNVSQTFIDIEKPRTTQEFKGAITPNELGNFVK